MGEPEITHPDRRTRPLRSAIDMTWPFSTPLRLEPLAGPLGASWSRSANTVLSMNVSTSRPIESASSSATTNARGLTHKAHRREWLYRIARCVLQRPSHGLSRGMTDLLAVAWGKFCPQSCHVVVAQSWQVVARAEHDLEPGRGQRDPLGPPRTTRLMAGPGRKRDYDSALSETEMPQIGQTSRPTVYFAQL